MSHNITSRDGMFTVRKPAWHYDQTKHHIFTDYPTREEAQRIAHPWEPVTEPLYRAVPTFVEKQVPSQNGEGWETVQEPVTRYEQVEDWQATVRSDIGTTLGVVTTQYEPVTNNEMYDIAEAIQGEGNDVRFETGGSLFGGRKVWLLLRLNEPIVLGGKERTASIPYFALQNDHSGKASFRGQAIQTCIVCDNTASFADMEASASGTEFAFRHTSSVRERIEEAKMALAGWRHSVAEFHRFNEFLLDQQVTNEQIGNFITTFIPMPPPHMSSPRVETNVKAARQQMLSILKSETCKDIHHTAYGLVQASIEYHQHFRKARSAETRFRRAYLDRSTVVSDAVGIVKDLIGAGA